tara:strand:+ start:8465 stop:8626 length:162 start_codon:yes stop_codon:yes gene_type:complete
MREHYSQAWLSQFKSPIPPHLTPEEHEIWKKELEWDRQEHERRKKEGYYPSEE